jgi:hypothetical protein
MMQPIEHFDALAFAIAAVSQFFHAILPILPYKPLAPIIPHKGLWVGVAALGLELRILLACKWVRHRQRTP